MSQLTSSLIASTGEGWITNETAAKVIATLLGELDIAIDVTEELKAAEKEKEEKQLDQTAMQNARLQQMMDANSQSDNGQGKTPDGEPVDDEENELDFIV